MPRNDVSGKALQARKQRKDAFTRAKLVEDDPRRILERAQKKPLRIGARIGGRDYHLSTIRAGIVTDPTYRISMPVKVSTLKRHGERILYLASAIQIALRVEVGKNATDVFFFEPGRHCQEFTLARLGGSVVDGALFKRILRHSLIARAAADATAEQLEARGREEIDVLKKQIGLLDRSLKQQVTLSAKLERSNAALRKSQTDRAAAEAAAKQTEAQQQREITQLNNRIRGLERSLRKQAADEKASREALDVKHDPSEDAVSADNAENGSVAMPPS